MPDAALTHEDALARAATGDLWLFRGRSLADVAIRTLTNAPVNHVGMVVALDDLPPLLWHAEMGRSLPDVWTGQHQRGVQLHRLGDAVRTWEERYGQVAYLRQLEGTITRVHEDRLIETIERYDGSPFPRTLGLARSWLTGRVRRSRGHEGDALLRRARRDHLPGDGPAPEPAPGELVRPGPVLDGRPDRPRPAVLADRARSRCAAERRSSRAEVAHDRLRLGVQRGRHALGEPPERLDPHGAVREAPGRHGPPPTRAIGRKMPFDVTTFAWSPTTRSARLPAVQDRVERAEQARRRQLRGRLARRRGRPARRRGRSARRRSRRARRGRRAA